MCLSCSLKGLFPMAWDFMIYVVYSMGNIYTTVNFFLSEYNTVLKRHPIVWVRPCQYLVQVAKLQVQDITTNKVNRDFVYILSLCYLTLS